MMGRTHATSGAVLALASVPVLNAHGIPTTGWAVPVLAITAAGAAMLPDFDHAHATIAQSLGPVTKVIARVVGILSGGHRHGTHSFVGVAAFTLVSWLMVRLGGIPLGVWLAFLLAIASSALHVRFSKRSVVVHTIICIVGGVLLVRSSMMDAFPTGSVVVGTAIGAMAHLLGDLLTRQGCPLLWPFLPTRFKVANLTTDHFTERVIIGPALGVIAVVLAIRISGLGVSDIPIGVPDLSGLWNTVGGWIPKD